MKKSRKDKFLEFLLRAPNVSSACEATGLSRMCVYRWRKEDNKFAKAWAAAFGFGVKSINDLAEGKLINCIQRGEPWAIKLWLENNKRNYARPRPKDFWAQLAPPKIAGFSLHMMKTEDDIKRFNELKELERKYGKDISAKNDIPPDNLPRHDS